MIEAPAGHDDVIGQLEPAKETAPGDAAM